MIIYVKAKPSANEDKVVKIKDNRFEVFTKAPPIKGLANRAITDLLAGYFNTNKTKVKMVSGFTTRQKHFEIIE